MSSMKVIRNLTAAGLTLLLVSAGGIANAKVINGATTLVRLTATALGSNETGGLGVKTGSASAVFTLNVVKGTICYSLKDRGLVAVKYSHIHRGASGTDGAVVVNLNAKNFNAVGNTCTSATKTLLSDIVRNPSMYYFNVHTAAFPNGAVRGQLTNGKKVINGATTLVRLTATALGSNETGGLGVKTGSASAVFTLNVVKGTICYSLKDRGLVAVKYSHIHRGASGTDGAVVVNLNAKNFNAVGNTCTSATKTLLSDIVRNPSMYYFNVHTAAFPNGAVRGQLTNGKKAKPVKKSTATPTLSTSPTPTPTKTSKY